jgi:ketosteroid isomerase-like protein
MSRENMEIVRRFLEAYNRRDPEAVATLIHPDVAWHTLAAPIFGIEVVHGRDKLLRFMFEQIPEALEDFRATLDGVSQLPDDRVLAAVRYEGRGVASGAEVKMNTAAIYRFEAGMIVFFQDFAHREKALEAAGLSE